MNWPKTEILETSQAPRESLDLGNRLRLLLLVRLHANKGEAANSEELFGTVGIRGQG